MSLAPHFDVARVNAALAGTRFAGHLHHFDTVTSTNADLLAAANDGAQEGTVYLADEQTAGRGRGGHTWHSVAGEGLYLSVLASPPLPLDRVLWISLATGLAVRNAIHLVTGLEGDIRWPNDLLLRGRKCGGILVETAVESGSLRHAVIGIGINLNHAGFPEALDALATSLRMEDGGKTIDRERFLIALLRALDMELAGLESNDESLFIRFVAASSWVNGKRVHVAEAGGYTGVTAGLNAAGFLQVRADDGALRTVLSGGVRSAATPTIGTRQEGA